MLAAVRRMMLVGALCVSTSIMSGDVAYFAAPVRPIGVDAVVALINASSPADDLFGGQFCGGVLVSPDLVLTAAHCLRNNRLGGIDAVVGADNLCKTAPIDGERRHVTQVLRHERSDGVYVDAALLVLDAPAEKAQPVQLPHPSDQEPTGGVALGWGRNGIYGVMPCRRLEVPLRFVVQNRCEILQRKLGVAPAVGWDLCAIPDAAAKRNTCTGDSGSPVLSPQAPATVVGVVTWGPTCRLDDVGVYLRAAALTSWIGGVVASRSHQAGFRGIGPNRNPGIQ